MTLSVPILNRLSCEYKKVVGREQVCFYPGCGALAGDLVCPNPNCPYRDDGGAQ